jgi:hypothetical protein
VRFGARIEAARWTQTTAATGHPIPDHSTLHTVPVRNLNADKCERISPAICGFLLAMLSGQRTYRIFLETKEVAAMNSLFLGLLTLFFAQGLSGRDNWGARMMAYAFVAGMAAAFACSMP